MKTITTHLASIVLLVSFICANALTPQARSNHGIIITKDEEVLIHVSDDDSLRKGACASQLTVRVVRGGGGSSANPLSNLKNFVFKAFQNLSSTLTKPFTFRSIKKPSILQSPRERRENKLQEQLRTVPIENVIVRNSTVLPKEVVDMAAKRAGLFGRPLQTEAVQEVANSLKQWYETNGFVLHNMIGVSVQVENRTAELAMEEPVSSKYPISITCCREMVIDPNDGSLLTLKQYRDTLPKESKIKKSDLNTTFVPIASAGKTKPNRIASAMGLSPGKSFRWNTYTWNRIMQSGLFRQFLKVAPERMPDGTVQLQMVVEEAEQRNLEYGVTKSQYTDGWGGEVDFSHKNILGGGECLTVSIRKGATRKGGPSVKLQFLDEKFGMPGGYDVQVFSDYIGENQGESDEEDLKDKNLLGRKGISFNLLRNSIVEKYGIPSMASACLERTSTKGGLHESVGSTTLSIGPISKQLPLQARTNIFGKFTIGTQFTDTLLPFSSVTATTRQTVPLASLSESKQPIVLALQHAVTVSTSGLPSHEAKSQGVACKIRGYRGENDRIATALVGTTELRFPLPRLEDAKLIVFGDWCASQAPCSSSFGRRASVGLGIRKSFQGMPLKYDISYTKEGKFGVFFGFGPDFDA